jgi:hypothetical protein
MGKNNRQKEKGIKILDPKKIDYTYTGKDDLLDIKPSSSSDGENIDSSRKSSTEKNDFKRIRYVATKDTKIKTKGRRTGGQTKQSHSSVYE